MKFIVTWTHRPEDRDAIHRRFLEGGDTLPPGMTQIGRWMAVGQNSGVAIYESESVQSIARHTLAWSDLMNVEVVPALSDHEVGPLLAELASANQRVG